MTKRNRNCFLTRQGLCPCGNNDALAAAKAEAAAAQEMAYQSQQSAIASEKATGEAMVKAEQNKKPGFLSTIYGAVPQLISAAAPAISNILSKSL